MQSIDETLKEAKRTLAEIDDEEQDPVKVSFAGLMEQLDKLSDNLRAMAQTLAPMHDEQK